MICVLWVKQSSAMNNKIYNLFIRNWFGTKGRASRLEFVCRFIMMPLLYMCTRFFYSFFYIDEDDILCLISGLMGGFVFTPLFILSVIQVFFVTHRRLHDLNASGWWQLITFIPLGQILMIGFIFFKGTQGPNKYGEEPKY